jgi:hypothetical protein
MSKHTPKKHEEERSPHLYLSRGEADKITTTTKCTAPPGGDDDARGGAHWSSNISAISGSGIYYNDASHYGASSSSNTSRVLKKYQKLWRSNHGEAMIHDNDLTPLLSFKSNTKNKGATTTSTTTTSKMISDETHNMNNNYDNRRDAYAGVDVADCSYESHEYDGRATYHSAKSGRRNDGCYCDSQCNNASAISHSSTTNTAITSCFAPAVSIEEENKSSSSSILHHNVPTIEWMEALKNIRHFVSSTNIKK